VADEDSFETLDKINETLVDESHRPYKDVRITHTVILEDPFDDPDGLEIPDKSPEVTEDILKEGRLGEDLDNDGKTEDQLEEEAAEKEAKSRAIVLEMIGDLPHADVAPPENVLFVCKLNPVTTDEDLQVIFSRFGKING
jgi:peptidyl-prolyl cis-trans isomerase-like 4